MPHWVSNRLVLSGPQAELERLQRTCIRSKLDNDSDEKSLDLEALAPMPATIAATLEDCSPTAKQAAFSAAGFESWYEWRLANWGCKWNASSFELITVAPGLLDVAFETPWSVPEPALVALAAQFPLLSGRVYAIEPSMAWGLVGELQDGSYTSTPADPSPELSFFVSGWVHHPEFRLKTAQALVEHPEGLSDAAVASIWMSLAERLPPELTARLRLSFDVQRFSDWSNSNKLSKLEDLIQDPANLSFLRADGRGQYSIDRELMGLLAQDILATWGRDLSGMQLEDDLRRSIAYLLLGYDESYLRKWAFHAVFRPDAALDFADLASLQDGFLQYAIGQRQRMLQHLDAAQDGKHHSVAIAAGDGACRYSQAPSHVVLT